MKRKGIIAGIILIIFFVVFTVCIKNIDICDAGAEGYGKIGFSSLNIKFAEIVGVNNIFYQISEYLGYVAFAFACFAGFTGLYFLVKKRSFLKVPLKIYATGVLYLIDIIIYFVSDKIVINLRPVIENGVYESSYPSSHTLLTICVCASVFVYTDMFIKKEKERKLIKYVSVILATATVITRTLSGYHWFTDIVGCIILSSALVCFYISAVDFIDKKEKNKQC